MKLPGFLRGFPMVARHEFVVNMRSVRLLIMLAVLALIVVGGAYGLSAGPGGGISSLPPLVGWGHAAVDAADAHVAVVWVSDPFGAPSPDRTVRFLEDFRDGDVIDEVTSDPDGFARLPVGNRSEVGFTVRSGASEFGSSIFWFPERTENFTVGTFQADLDNDGLSNELGIHVLDQDGTPADAQIFVNGTSAATVDPYGYARVTLPPGGANVTVEVAGEPYTIFAFVPEPFESPFQIGPDFVLLIIAVGFAGFGVPIFAIVLSFDALSKERVQGTLDLLLSRPVSRAGVLLGKFGGAFAAVAVPVTLVNLAGIGVLTLVSGKAPTGSFAAAFLLLELLLIAFYVPLQLIFSALAKTSGTAILFGVLVWLAFNVLYPVITTVLGLVVFANNPEGYFRFLQAVVLGNPTQIYQQLIVFAAPQEIGSGVGQFGGTSLDLPVLAIAAAGWLAGLLALALWTWQRRAAE